MKNLLVAQSGGPTAAINATLCGVVEKALMQEGIDHVYGAKYGVAGILNDNLIELENILNSSEKLQLLCQTPGAALGSCRLKLKDWTKDESDFEQIFKIFKKYNIGYFVYIGGNDSMDTVYKLSEYAALKKIDDIKIMGAPKTIDNDLCETDHCPGFGSAAKYIASTFAELSCDCDVYDIPAVTIVEVMGRDAGWLTAASALAKVNGASAPDLIYLCEKPFSVSTFLSDVRAVLEKKPTVVVAVSEGIHDENGVYIADSMQNTAVDAFGHKILAGAAQCLKDIVSNEIGCKVRSIELNLMQRCAGHIASGTDLYESKLLGYAAADHALCGCTGKMACIKRLQDKPYTTKIEFESIQNIANKVKTVPLSWINKEGNGVTQEMIDYLLPLMQGEVKVTYNNGIPEHIKLL